MGAITDIAGIKVGQTQDEEALTGVTVVLVPQGAVGAVDVRGAAPGTRETDLLDPANLVQQVHAIVLCGGSALGLAAASGVANYLHERGFGYDTPSGKIPIVPAAVIYDLGVGQSDKFPDPLMGYLACSVAETSVMEGNFGAGAGASIGKILGNQSAMKSGVGTASARLNLPQPAPAGTHYTVGALVVNNAFGDVYQNGQLIAGACRHPGGQLLDTARLMREGLAPGGAAQPGANTTLAVVATDAPLTKTAARRLAMMAQDGLARSLHPAHTMFDGDVVFALSTGGLPSTPDVDPFLLTALGTLAAELVAEAIVRSVTETQPAAHLPAFHQPAG